jgi:hypothetical protein
MLLFSFLPSVSFLISIRFDVLAQGLLSFLMCVNIVLKSKHRNYCLRVPILHTHSLKEAETFPVDNLPLDNKLFGWIKCRSKLLKPGYFSLDRCERSVGFLLIFCSFSNRKKRFAGW